MQKPNVAIPANHIPAETTATNPKVTNLIARDYSSTMITIVAQYDSAVSSDEQYTNLINVIEALIKQQT